MQYNYYPKKPLKSFQDLEVYQKTLEASVILAKIVSRSSQLSDVESKSQKGRAGKAKGNVGSGSSEVREMIVKNMLPCALGIPHQIAEAHSLRFGDHTAAIATIEKAMLACNKIIVYIEQFRDICDSGIAWEVFDDLIKKYLYVRRKILNLQRVWKKFMPQQK